MKNVLLLIPGIVLSAAAHASCGSSFCTVNTNWDTQGMAHDSGLLVDLRYSYAKADQWRAGASKKATEEPGGGSDEEIENKRTINQIATLGLDYSINRQWGIALALPFIVRDHAHTFDSSVSGPFTQQAKFSDLGDIRLVGKYKFSLSQENAGAGLRFGFKLPTGAIRKTMSPPDPREPDTAYPLERSSQPGTGSTDAILGAYYFSNLPGNATGWFVSTQLQTAIATRDGYRPGEEVSLDLGMHHEVAHGLNLLLQLNAQHKARDTGINANPASGGYSVSLSPGFNYALDSQTQVYSYVQLPIVRYLNTDPADAASGQLSARWALTAGVNRRF